MRSLIKYIFLTLYYIYKTCIKYLLPGYRQPLNCILLTTIYTTLNVDVSVLQLTAVSY